MRWNVEGADSQTGQETVIAVEATDQTDAERQARQRGILISTIYLSTIKTPVERLEEEVAAALRSDIPPSTTSPAPINYRSAGLPREIAPQYRGLQIGSSVLMIFAMLYYILGGVLFVLGVLSAAGSAVISSGPIAAGGVLSIFWGLGLAMVGGILHALSAACIALRDIARNSFNR